jgi:hypothetical protein
VSAIRDTRFGIGRTLRAIRDTRVRLVVLVYCQARATPNDRLRPNAATTVDCRVGLSDGLQRAMCWIGLRTRSDRRAPTSVCDASGTQSEACATSSASTSGSSTWMGYSARSTGSGTFPKLLPSGIGFNINSGSGCFPFMALMPDTALYRVGN